VINSWQSAWEQYPHVTPLDDGGFLVTWASADGSGYGIYGQRFDAQRNMAGGEWQINTYTSDHQSLPAAAGIGPEHFVVVWQSEDQDGSGYGVYGQVFEVAPAAEVVARHVFYNESKWDASPGNPDGDPAANEYDDNAIATDKTALLPDETAGFQNYTSYSKGINGIMVDVARLRGTPTADDFELKMGNDDNPDGWTAAPDPSITVRPGEGTDGSDRVTLVWPNYDTVNPDPATQAVAKQWLQVTVLPTANTGLAEPDVFYFGNAVAESGLGNFGGWALVNAVDSGAVRDNPHNPYVDPAPLDDLADYNRDQWVNAVDFRRFHRCSTIPARAIVGWRLGFLES